jgi:serine/threonine-protein kinase
MSVVAGSGVSGSSGDGGPAIAAQVESWTIATGPSGELYLDAASRYRVIDAAGMIAPFAGSGVPGWSGDGGPATEASILTAAGIAVAPDGRVFLGDQARIRMVDTTGVITTIAGTGSSGVPADGASARASQLLAPGPMAVGPEGSLYLVDGDAVRMIDPSGVMRTVAGAVTSGAGPHCGSALGPTLASPGGLAVHDGALYIADTGNARVVKVVP